MTSLHGVSQPSKEVAMKRYTIPRVAHCSEGCPRQSWAWREKARTQRLARARSPAAIKRDG